MSVLSWIGLVVVVFWLLGLLFKIAGAAIHLLLVVAVIVFIIDWIRNRTNKGKK